VPSNRVANLRAALAAVLVQAHTPELALMHRWLDSWAGIGRVAVGMARQGYDLQLTRYDERGRRAAFYPTGIGTRPRGRPV
jgi:hypothetical protein